jgi:hypothetical protein
MLAFVWVILVLVAALSLGIGSNAHADNDDAPTATWLSECGPGDDFSSGPADGGLYIFLLHCEWGGITFRITAATLERRSCANRRASNRESWK